MVTSRAVDLDLTGVDVLEAGDGVQQRGLAAAGRAEQHGELAASIGRSMSFSTFSGPNDLDSPETETADIQPFTAPAVMPRTK